MYEFPSDTRRADSGQPPVCPFCRSQQVSTTSKAVSDATYWRCGTCGQIWNESRLLSRKFR